MRLSIVATVAVCLLAAASQVRLFTGFTPTIQGREKEMATTLLSFALCPGEQRRTRKPTDIADLISRSHRKLHSESLLPDFTTNKKI